MKKYFILLFLLFFNSILMAQTLTFEEAKNIAHQLYETELVSEKGEKHLLKEIEKNNTENNSDSVEKSFVLKLLVDMFQTDFMYRMGMDRDILIDKKTRHNRQKSSSTIPTNEEKQKYEQQMKKMEEEFKKQEWYKIEQEIEDEDPNESETKGFIIFPMIIRSKEHGLISKKRSVLGKTRTRTLNDLLKVNLIDSLVFDNIYIKKGELSTEGYICSAALKKVEYYQNFEDKKGKQITLINKLEKGNVISQLNKAKLINSYQDWELKKLYEFIAFCNDVKVVHLENYPNSVEKAYKIIFEEIKEIVPVFDFENLELYLETEKPNYEGQDTFATNMIISFNIDSTHYTHSAFYGYIKKGETTNYNLTACLEFHKIINKVLQDQNSDKKLYFAILYPTFFYLKKSLNKIDLFN